MRKHKTNTEKKSNTNTHCFSFYILQTSCCSSFILNQLKLFLSSLSLLIFQQAFIWHSYIQNFRLACFKNSYFKRYLDQEKSGFTLIEVLITLIIMGILMSVLIPNFSKLQIKAKETAVKNIGHNFQLSIESYFLSEGNYPNLQNAGVEELYRVLAEKGEMKEMPKNPFTSRSYTNQDSSGKILYTLQSEGYLLDIFGYENTNQILTIKK